jgi:hypothetical protein
METTAGAPGQLLAGVARIDITRKESGETSDPLYANIDAKKINDPLYVKALVLKKDAITVVIITIDAVAIAEIGSIRNEYLAEVRARLNAELKIEATNILINASHCHGVVCANIEQRTVQAVKEAWHGMVPVTIGAGTGYEDRITENRRLKLKSGGEADVRHAYSLPPDEEIDSVGPIDPEIGVLRLDRTDGRPLAILYNFSCHPIQGVPSGGNTADITGFACKAIEDSAGNGTIALFLQGCAGDVNPVFYKDVDHPRDAETQGNLLGLSTVRALQDIQTEEDRELKLIHETIRLPRADLAPHIEALQDRQLQLLQSLQGTTLNLKTFLSLMIKHHLSPDFPSYYSHRYFHDRQTGRNDLAKLDAENRKNLELYIDNIHTMEELTRVRANLDLLKMHHAQNLAAGDDTIEVEVVGLRIGEFVLITFPGEPSVQIGLNIKEASPHELTFVSGVTNGYIYYAPTAEQLKNRGRAQEDSDCFLAPEWQKLFEDKAAEILRKL